MKSRNFFAAIALIAGIVLVVGIAGFWGLTSQNPRTLISQGGQEVPTAAQFVPRQAPVMVSVLARPDRLWQLRQLFTDPGKRYEARQEWQSLKTVLTDAVGWDYETDVRPWLDQEVSFAVTATDIDRDQSNGQQAGYLFVLSCRDGEQAREAIHLLWQKRTIAGRNLVFETASDIPLVYDRQPASTAFSQLGLPDVTLDSLASAVIGDRYVLLANHPQVLRQAIATFQAPDVSLDRESTYRASLKALPPNRIGWVYANAPTLLAWLGLEPSETVRLVANEGRKANHLFVSLQATRSGLMGNTAIAAAPGAAFDSHSRAAQSSDQILSLLPPDARFVVSGHNLADLLTESSESIGGYAVARQTLEAFFNTLSLPSGTTAAELWHPLQSEYALGLAAGTEPAWFLAAQAHDSDAFENMDDAAREQNLNVSHVRFQDQDITAWTKLAIAQAYPNGPANLATQVVGVHSRVKGYEVFSTSLQGLQSILQTADQAPSLREESAFTELLDTLDKPYNNLTYIDWPQLAPDLLKRSPLLRALNQAGQPLTAHLGPIFTAGYGQDALLQEGVIAVKLIESP